MKKEDQAQEIEEANKKRLSFGVYVALIKTSKENCDSIDKCLFSKILWKDFKV
jgi:hypothetical protein